MLPGQSTTQFDQLNKRCVHLLKVALKPEIWGRTATLNLKWMNRTLELAEQPTRNDQTQANHVHVHICLDVLCYLVTVMPADAVVTVFTPLQRALASCLMCGTTTVGSLFLD